MERPLPMFKLDTQLHSVPAAPAPSPTPP
jgi:hypothetical protein